MADSTKRTIEIAVNVTGVESAAKLTSLAEKFTTLADAAKNVTTLLNSFKSAIDQIKFPKEFSNVVDSLKELSKVKKLPDLDNIAKGFEKLGKIGSNLPNLSPFITELKKFAGVKVPNITQVANVIKKLNESTLNIGEATTRLNKLYYSIKNFDGMKFPNMHSFIGGFKEFESLKIDAIATKIGQLGSAIRKLSESGSLKHFATFASDLRNLSSSLDRSVQSMGRTETAVRSLGNSFDSAGKQSKSFGDRLRNYMQYRIIADTIMGLQQAFRSGMSAIFEYDQALKDLQAITGATGLEVAQMGLKIKEVASGTKFSASEVAEGMRTIGQAGFSASEAIGTMQSVSDLATGTLSDMSTSVDLVTTAMRVFNIDASQSSRVSDVFANAVNKSKLTIDKLRTAMNYVGPIAKNAGVTFEEMSAAMMTLANSGIQASKIGTGLRRVFAELLSPSEKLQDAARNAGIALQELDPRTASLSDVFKNLKIVVSDAEVAFNLFGKRGTSAVLALTDSNSQFDSLLNSVGKSGTAAAMAAVQIEGLGVSFKNLKDKLGLLAIAIGELGITDVLRVLIDVSKSVVDAITAIADTALARFIGKGVIFVGSIWAIHKAFVAIQALNIGMIIGAAVGKMIALTAATITAQGAADGLLLAFNPLIAVFAAATAGLIYMFSTLDNAKEAAEDAAILADKYAALGKTFQDHKVETSNMAEGSKELKEENLKLRASLLETASGMSEISDEAAEAAASINPLTGEIYKNGEALEKYNNELSRLSFQSLSDSAGAAGDNVEKQTSGINRVVNRWKDAFNQVGTLGEGVGNSIVSAWEGDFSAIPGIVGKALSKTSEYSEEFKKAFDFSKELNKGNKSFKEFSDYVNSLNMSNLTNQQKDLAESYKLLNERTDKFLSGLIESGKVDLNDTIENIKGIEEATELTGIELEAFIEKIKILKGLDSGGFSNVIEKWANDSELLNGRVSDMIPKFIELGGEIDASQATQIINGERIMRDLVDQYGQAKENLAADLAAGKDKEKAYKEFYAVEKSLLKQAADLNAETAKNTAAQVIISLQKAKDELTKSQNEINVKYKDNIELLVKYLMEAETKYETAKSKILGNVVDPKELLAQSKTIVGEITETYAGMYKDLELEVLNKTKTEKEAAAIRRSLEQKEAKEIIDIWNNANNLIIAQNDPDSPAVRSINNARRDAAIEQGKIEVEISKEIAEEQLKAKQNLFDREKEQRETNFAEYITIIEQQEQKGILTHEEAETAKMNASLDRYAEEYRMAKEFHDKIDEGQNPEAHQASLDALLNAEEAFYEEKGKFIETYNKQVEKLHNDLENKQDDLLKQEKAHSEKIKDINDDLADDLIEIAEDLAEKKTEAEYQYTIDVEALEYDLADKIKDIKKDLADDLKDIDEEILENKKKLNAELLDIESSTNDIEKDIRQRGMTDREKSTDNEKSIYRELKTIREGVAEAERAGDAEAIKHYQDRLKELQKESTGIDDKGKALSALHSVEKDMIATTKSADYVKTIELENEALKKQAEAKQKILDAEQDTSRAKAILDGKYDHELSLIDQVTDKKIASTKKASADAIEAENYRHNLVMDNLDTEIAKLNEKLQYSSNAAADASSSVLTEGSGSGAVSGTSGSSGGGKSNPIAEQAIRAKQAIVEMDTQMNETATNMIQKSKEIADTGFRSIEENGKIIFTNLSDAQRNAFQVMDEAMTGASESSMTAISESTKQGAAQIVEAVSQMKQSASDTEIPINVQQNPEIPDVQSKFPEDVKVPLKLDVDTVNNDVGVVTSSIMGLANVAVAPEINLNTEDANSKIKSIITDLGALAVRDANSITLDTSDVDVAARKISDLFDGIDPVEPKQKLQDMITTMHGMGPASSQVFNSMTKEIVDFANTIDGVDVSIDMNKVLAPDTWARGFMTITDGAGNLVDNLNKNVQSNPIDLFPRDQTLDIIRRIDNIAGAAELVQKQLDKESELKLDVTGAESNIDRLADEVIPNEELMMEVSGDTEPVEGSIEGLQQHLQDNGLDIKMVPDTQDAAAEFTAFTENPESYVMPVEVNSGESKEEINELKTELSSIDDSIEPIDAVVNKEELDAFVTEVDNLEDKEVSVSASGAVRSEEEVALLATAIKTIEDKDVTVDAEITGDTEVAQLGENLIALEDKTIAATADVTGLDEVEELSQSVDDLDDKEIKIEISLMSDGNDVEKRIDAVTDSITEFSNIEPEVTFNFDIDELEDIKGLIEELDGKGVLLQISVEGEDAVQQLSDLLSEINDNFNPLDITTTVEVEGKEEVAALKLLIEEIQGLAQRVIRIVAEVTGTSKVYELRDAIASLQDKIVNVTTRFHEEGKRPSGYAHGGEVEQYADGGNVFRRLANRYIGTGSGHKDDVPALLMKGEFVHRTAAVQKYGKRFMEMVNSGLYPVELAKKAIYKYATGGSVDLNINPSIDTTGFVQQFASGGMVMSNMLSSLKKKLFEMLGSSLGSDVSLNIDKVQLNNEITQKADSVTSQLGVDSLKTMANNFDGAVQKLASGGSINEERIKIEKEAQEIYNTYNEQVVEAKRDGNDEIAAILAAEKEKLQEVSEALTSELIAIQNTYNESVAQKEEESAEEQASIQSEYDRDASDEEASYARDVEDDELNYRTQKEDDELDYRTQKEDYERNVAEEKAEYLKQVDEDTLDYAREKSDFDIDAIKSKEDLEEKLAEIEVEIADNQAKILSDLMKARDDVDEKIKALNKFGEKITNVRNTNNSRFFKDGYYRPVENYSYLEFDDDMNNFSLHKFESLIRSSYTGGTGKLGTEGAKDAQRELEAFWDEFTLANIALREYGISDARGLLDGGYGRASDPSAEISKQLGILIPSGGGKSVLESLSEILNKNINVGNENSSAAKKEKEINEYNEKEDERKSDWQRYEEDYKLETAQRDNEHSTNLADLDFDWERYNNEFKINTNRRDDEYKINTNRRDYDHDLKLSDLKEKYNIAMSNDSESLKESLAEFKNTYDTDTYTAQTNAAEDITNITESSSADVASAKENLQTRLADLENSYKEEMLGKTEALKQIIKPSEVNIDDVTSVNEFSSDEFSSVFDDFMKKFKLARFNFPGYNVGGMVDHISGSIPGKDSIMAALTPGEFIIKEPVVRQLGSGFFEAINNFRIPKFNLGGVVGPIQKSITESVQSNVERHALDLTINGKQYESLYGSSIGIGDLINDLTLAKMRS